MREKVQILDEFWVKVIGMIVMTLDHVGLFLISYFGSNLDSAGYLTGFIFRCIGRIAFPLFAFMLAEGMLHSKKPLKYIGRIAIVWAVCFIGQCVLIYGFKYDTVNFASPLTDLLLCALVLYCLKLPKYKKLFSLLPIGVILMSYGVQLYEGFSLDNIEVVWLPEFARAGYSLYGLAITLGFFYAPAISQALSKASLAQLDEGSRQAFLSTKTYRSLINLVGISFFVVITLIFWGLHYVYQPEVSGVVYNPLDPYNMSIESYGLLAVFILMAYNEKRGYDNKLFRYVSYSYFPVHLAIIYLIFRIIFGY